MDDFWNESDTAPSTLDNFFDEDSDVNWTGSSRFDIDLPAAAPSRSTSLHEKVGLDSTCLTDDGLSSSILDNVSVNSNSSLTSSVIGNRPKSVGKSIGEKLDSWKTSSVSLKWNATGIDSRQCIQCLEKDEEINLLRKRLERSYSRHVITLPPEDTVKRILLNQPYSLECYKSKEDKIALLDSAIQTLDSSTILAIVLFIRNTLKMSSFNQELQARPNACQIYINYLKQRSEYTEVLDFLGMLGRTEEAAMMKYKLALSSRGMENKIKNLRNALQTHFSSPTLAQEANAVKEHLELIEYQAPIDAKDSLDQNNPTLKEYPRASSLIDKSQVTTLYYLCMYHWNVSESSPESPQAFKKRFSISDKHFLWTVLRARARIGHWPLPGDLEGVMGNKSILGTLSALTGVSGRLVKSLLPIERVVETLASNGAPSNVLSAYLGLLSSPEIKLKLALIYSCHQTVIDVCVAQKERQALEKYIKDLTEGTSEFMKAEYALKNTKWKN